MMASIPSGRMNDDAPQEFGSLYGGDDIEGSVDEMISKGNEDQRHLPKLSNLHQKVGLYLGSTCR